MSAKSYLFQVIVKVERIEENDLPDELEKMIENDISGALQDKINDSDFMINYSYIPVTEDQDVPVKYDGPGLIDTIRDYLENNYKLSIFADWVKQSGRISEEFYIGNVEVTEDFEVISDSIDLDEAVVNNSAE